MRTGKNKQTNKKPQKVLLSLDSQQLPARRNTSQGHAPPHVSQKPSYLFIPDAVSALGVGSSTAARGGAGPPRALPHLPAPGGARDRRAGGGRGARSPRGASPALGAAGRARCHSGGAPSALPRCTGPGRPAARAGAARRRPPLVGRSAPVAGRRESGLAPPRPAPPPAQAQT